MASSNPSASTKLTVLDRTVRVILADADSTASHKNDNISARLERLHLWHGASLIRHACIQLDLGPSALATASTLLHRYFHQVSLKQSDVWSVAMACTLLATKLEEQPKTLHQIIQVYAKFKLSKGWSRFLAEGAREGVSSHSPPLNKLGPVYQEWHSTITKTENLLLRQLGFTLYWIPDSHPHKFLLYYCKVLEWKPQSNDDDDDDTKNHHHHNNNPLVQSAWNYCNDACSYLGLGVRYSAQVIACSAILCTAMDYGVELAQTPRPWWQVFVGSDENGGQQDVVDAANAMAGLVHLQRKSKDKNGDNVDATDAADVVDWLLAQHGFIRSLVTRTRDHETSFNDPNSFLWEYQKEVFEKQFSNK